MRSHDFDHDRKLHPAFKHHDQNHINVCDNNISDDAVKLACRVRPAGRLLQPGKRLGLRRARVQVPVQDNHHTTALQWRSCWCCPCRVCKRATTAGRSDELRYGRCLCTKWQRHCDPFLRLYSCDLRYLYTWRKIQQNSTAERPYKPNLGCCLFSKRYRYGDNISRQNSDYLRCYVTCKLHQTATAGRPHGRRLRHCIFAKRQRYGHSI